MYLLIVVYEPHIRLTVIVQDNIKSQAYYFPSDVSMSMIANMFDKSYQLSSRQAVTRYKYVINN